MTKQNRTRTDHSRWLPFVLGFLICLATCHLQAGEQVTSSIDDKPLKAGETLDKIQSRMQKVVSEKLNTVVKLGSGSGVIVSPNGHILSMHHVIEGFPEQFQVIVGGDQKVTVQKLGSNRLADLAMLKIKSDQTWPYSELGCSSVLKPGQWTVALSYPAYLSGSKPPLAQLARVLATSPRWVGWDPTGSAGGVCGGPIFDLEGKLIAINGGGPYSNRGMVVTSIDFFREEWSRLARGDRYSDPVQINRFLMRRIGCTLASGIEPPEIAVVLPDSVTEKAGLQPFDVVLAIDEKQIQSGFEFTQAIPNFAAGGSKNFSVRRGTELRDFSVQLRTLNRVPVLETANEYFNGNSWLNQHPEIEQYQRNTRTNIQAFKDSVADAAASTVSVLVDGSPNRLGTIVDSDGYIVTASAELTGEFTCRFSDGKICDAQLVHTSPGDGIAILKVDSANLNPVVWHSSDQPVAGTLVALSQINGTPYSFGMVSTPPRAILKTLDGQVDIDESCRVRVVRPFSDCQRTGIQVRDRFHSMNGIEIESVGHFYQLQRAHPPGDLMKLVVERIEDSGETNQHTFEIRSPGIRSAFFHGATTAPTLLGGPVVGIDGLAIGINVGTIPGISTYAIPGELALSVLQQAKEKTR